MTVRRALRPCGPGSCVSTQAPLTDPLRRIEPLVFAGPHGHAMRAVLAVLFRTPRLRVLERDDVAVHAVVRTPILRVPFDIELIVDEGRGRIDLRMSSSVALRESSGSRARATELLRNIETELRATV